MADAGSYKRVWCRGCDHTELARRAWVYVKVNMGRTRPALTELSESAELAELVDRLVARLSGIVSQGLMEMKRTLKDPGAEGRAVAEAASQTSGSRNAM
jgi:hypothetical protein